MYALIKFRENMIRSNINYQMKNWKATTSRYTIRTKYESARKKKVS